GNVRAATHDLHVTWPVALDNAYGTWTAYSNQYWPAEYLIDRRGDIRRVHFGEGEYGVNEQAIRQLLQAPAAVHARAVPDETPTLAVTPESYLGFARLDPARYAGTPIHRNVMQTYAVSTHL